jgi:hypothetical protein
VAVEVTARPPPTLTGPARLFVIAYPPEDVPEQGSGAPQAPPSFAWMSDPVAAPWPVILQVPIPPGLTASAILDLDGDGRPGWGDITSSPMANARGDGKAPVQFVLDHPIAGNAPKLGAPVPLGVGAGPGGPGGPPGGEGKGPEGPQSAGVQIEAQGVPMKAVRLVVTPSGAPAERWKGMVVIAGFPPGQRPKEGQPPAFFWTSGPSDLPWPPAFDLSLPVGLDLVVVEDKDGDGRPSPGDASGAPLLAFTPTGPEVALVMDQSFGGGPEGGGPDVPGGPKEPPSGEAPAKLPWER